MTPLRRFLLAVVLGLLLAPAAPAATGEPVPAEPSPAAEEPRVEELLDLGSLPEEAVDRSEPPVLARPDAAVFNYGERIPRATCLPYRACAILLHPDEVILNLAIGDSERWQIENFSSPATTPTVVFKPTAPNLLTNLVVKTDQRLYLIELLSPSPGATHPRNTDASYDALVTFLYPYEWAQTVGEPSPPAQAVAPAGASGVGPSRLHFAYRFDPPLRRKHRLPWTPDVVYDDGERTYIHLPPEARHHDLPAVLDLSSGGEPAPLAASLTGEARDWLVVPTVAERLRLVTRSGDATRSLTLLRTP
jgi:type IV secretory pathway VirB9-like protein